MLSDACPGNPVRDPRNLFKEGNRTSDGGGSVGQIEGVWTSDDQQEISGETENDPAIGTLLDLTGEIVAA